MTENDDRMRQYFLKSANKGEISPTEIETDTDLSALELSRQEADILANNTSQEKRKIRVIDRFGIILQIFASRAKHRSA